MVLAIVHIARTHAHVLLHLMRADAHVETQLFFCRVVRPAAQRAIACYSSPTTSAIALVNSTLSHYELNADTHNCGKDLPKIHSLIKHRPLIITTEVSTPAYVPGPSAGSS